MVGYRTKKVINTNLSLNTTNSILAQYRENTMNDVLSGANKQNQQLAYLKTVNDLSNSNSNKVILDRIENNIQHWDDTTKGLTGAGNAFVAAAAVTIAIGSGGIGTGISGANEIMIEAKTKSKSRSNG